MKKIITLILVTAMLISLAACAAGGSGSRTSSPSPSNTAKQSSSGTKSTSQTGDTPYSWESLYISPDYSTYKKPASENGLADTLVFVEGEVKSSDNYDDSVAHVVEDKDGNDWLLLEYGEDSEFPSKGDSVKAFGAYLGVSELLDNLPAILLTRYIETDGYRLTDILVEGLPLYIGYENSNTSSQSRGTLNSDDIVQLIDVESYSYTNIIRTEWLILVLKNNSEYNLDVNVDVVFKDADGKIVGAESESVDAFESGCEIALTFMNDEPFETFEYEITAKEEEWFGCVLSDLSYEVSVTSDKIIVSTTNNGDYAADFVEGTALFFLDGMIVNHDTTYFTDDDFELKPGKTIIKEMSCYDDFDDYKIYFTGRR